MGEIKVKYFYDGEPYRLNGNRFDIQQILAATKRFQQQYEQFADEINAEGGFLAIHLSQSNLLDKGIHYEVNIEHIPDLLREKIAKSMRR